MLIRISKRKQWITNNGMRLSQQSCTIFANVAK